MIAITDTLHLIIAALGTLLAAVAAIIGALAKKHAAEAQVQATLANDQATQANDAVNHRHETGTPRLYDLALENRQSVNELIDWKRGYDGGPLDDGQKVQRFWEEWHEHKKKLEAIADRPCMHPKQQ